MRSVCLLLRVVTFFNRTGVETSLPFLTHNSVPFTQHGHVLLFLKHPGHSSGLPFLLFHLPTMIPSSFLFSGLQRLKLIFSEGPTESSTALLFSPCYRLPMLLLYSSFVCLPHRWRRESLGAFLHSLPKLPKYLLVGSAETLRS